MRPGGFTRSMASASIVNPPNSDDAGVNSLPLIFSVTCPPGKVRSLLAASQARALEQERLLASERAKMARLQQLGLPGVGHHFVEREGIAEIFEQEEAVSIIGRQDFWRAEADA